MYKSASPESKEEAALMKKTAEISGKSRTIEEYYHGQALGVTFALVGSSHNEAFASLLLYLESLKLTLTLDDEFYAVTFEHIFYDDDKDHSIKG